MDGKKWFECSECQKWNHTDCELKFSDAKDSDMKKVAADLEQQGDDEIDESVDAKYWCIACRKKSKVKNERAK